MSDFRIYLAAGIIGEMEPLLSMIVSRPPLAAARRAVIDKSGPLATLAFKR